MRIIHLTSVHPYYDTRIFIKMCRSLAAAGHEVHFVVPRADTAQVEHRDGVAIHPVEPAKNRFQRMTGTVQAVLRAGAALGGDIYHFHDPEFLRLAPRWQKKLNKPFVYDVHEDYRVKIREKSWLPGFTHTPVEGVFRKIEDNAAAQLAGVVAANPASMERFLRHSAAVAVCNYPLLNELAASGKEAKRAPGAFVYIGGITLLRGALEMVRAAGLAGSQAELALAGAFSPGTLRDELAGLRGWGAVREQGVLDRQRLRILLARSSVGLVVLHPTHAYLNAYPTKLFEYMSASIPVIVSDIPLYRALIGSFNCALFVDPMDPYEIAKAMRWVMEHPAEASEMGRRGRCAVVEQYNWEAEIPKLLDLYDRITAGWGMRRKGDCQ